MKKILFTFLIFIFVSCSSNIESPFCVALSDSKSIKNNNQVVEENSTQISSDWALSFNPLFLPVKIVYKPSSGFSVIHTEEQNIITPLGTVGIQYTLGANSTKTINGHEITSGDYIVGIIDRKTNEKQLFKIEGYSRLKVIVEGRTAIDAQNGYVEIDVTESKVKELKFIDNSKMSIVNTTDEKLDFSFIIKDITSLSTENKCELDPKSYKNFPRFGFAKTLNELSKGEFFVRVKNKDSENNLNSTIERKIDFGDVCYIKYDENGKLTVERLIAK